VVSLLHCRTYRRGGVPIVHASGEVDLDSAPELRRALAAAQAFALEAVVVDLSEVTFMDSAGIAVLVGGIRHAVDNHGSLRLVVPATAKTVRRVLAVTELDRILAIHGNVDEAVSLIRVGQIP
jgi:anti-sigma B factor antagonist